MRILNIGSLNIDRVYGVEHFVSAGETLLAGSYATFCGGKGLNQSVALAKAGAKVYHAGMVGADGEILWEMLQQCDVHLDYLKILPDSVSGHAIIQVNPKGQNCILVYGGANGQVSKEYIDELLSHFGSNDLLLVQNEVTNVAHAIRQAKARGMKVAFNPSPVTHELLDYPLELLDIMILNEVEGAALTQAEDYEIMLASLCQKYPNTNIVLTLGSKGVMYRDATSSEYHGIYDVPVVDTTGAGDTFCGYFIASIARGLSVQKALELASRASSIAISRKGAATSIPSLEEVEGAKLNLIKKL